MEFILSVKKIYCWTIVYSLMIKLHIVQETMEVKNLFQLVITVYYASMVTVQ